MKAGAHIDYYFWLNSDWTLLGVVQTRHRQHAPARVGEQA